MSDFDDLLDAAREGDEAAWSVLYRKFSGRVLGYLRANGAADPEDLLGTVFMQVVEGLEAFRGDEANFGSWLFTIAHRRMLDDRRARSRRPQELMSDPTPSAVVPDAAETAIQGMAAEEHAELLALLPERQREVLVLRVVGDLSFAQIAEIVGGSVGAAKALQLRAVRNLRRILDEDVSK